jgi:glyoxylase-like metal-dependent hydrolase (beta-lactamase superfamily II)
MVAELTVLHEGYATDAGVASTVVLVLDGETAVVVDPGMVRSPALILEPLAAAGVTGHLALFPNARVHDVWAVYRGDQWDDQPAEGRQVSPSVRLIETPGHTPQDITTLVETATGLVACTHLWWDSQGPVEDPYATDPEALSSNRSRVLDLGVTLIVPGHGAAFVPAGSTPR